MSDLDCKVCGGKTHLEYRDETYNLTGEKEIVFVNAPVLVCKECGKSHIPFMTKSLMDEVCKLDENDTTNDIVKSTDESTMVVGSSVKDTICYDFDKIKNVFFSEKFISVKVKFIYDKDDYYFIPGLFCYYNLGFLTPVFFNIEVLLKYIHHPNYGLDIGADTSGYIYKNDLHLISFGLNENNKVIMWLGDIGELSVEEQFYLRSENIISDHSIGSEFYESQIENTWSKASAEKKLLKMRLEFNEKVRKNFGFSIAQLDTEAIKIAKGIRKLLINTEDAFKDLVIPLNELFVESINTLEIRKELNKQFPEIKDNLKSKKGIKILQLWLEKNTEGIKVDVEIAPLFVLYDLRLITAHPYSEESREEQLNYCNIRLGLEAKERDRISIANMLIEKLTAMYTIFNKALKTERMENNDER